MLKLDNNLLDELGLGTLPEAQKRAMLQHIYDTLELRVGTNLANQMTDRQLEEFEKFIDEGGDANQAQALQWLESNLPNYKQVVNEVFEELKAEIKQMAPQIMAASLPQTPAQPSMTQAQSQQMLPSAGAGFQQVPSNTPQPQVDYQPQPAPQPIVNPQSQDPSVYQFPTQQPPAGPGNYQQPYYTGDNRVA
jgi:hypothetical protein